MDADVVGAILLGTTLPELEAGRTVVLASLVDDISLLELAIVDAVFFDAMISGAINLKVTDLWLAVFEAIDSGAVDFAAMPLAARLLPAAFFAATVAETAVLGAIL